MVHGTAATAVDPKRDCFIIIIIRKFNGSIGGVRLKLMHERGLFEWGWMPC